MSQSVEMSGVGSLTIAALIVAVIFLLRNFYKRYNRAAKSQEPENSRDPGDDESK